MHFHFGSTPVLCNSAAFLAGPRWPNLQDTELPAASWVQVEGGSASGDHQHLCGLHRQLAQMGGPWEHLWLWLLTGLQ